MTCCGVTPENCWVWCDDRWSRCCPNCTHDEPIPTSKRTRKDTMQYDPVTIQYEPFRRSDLAAAVEALQVTYGNIVKDNPDAADDSVGIIITEELWDHARKRNSTGIGYCLGVMAFWASLNNLDTPSLEMRLKEVRDNAHR